MINFENTSLLKELKANVRLQWLLLLVMLILIISFLKATIDANAELYDELSAQQLATSRLATALKTPIDENSLESARENMASMLASIPVAASMNIAEAQALSRVTKLREKVYNQGRTSLVGTEVLNFGANQLYQTRIELSGSHNLLNFIEVLKHVDERQSHLRIMTLQLRAGSRNSSLTLVVDFLHKQEVL